MLWRQGRPSISVQMMGVWQFSAMSNEVKEVKGVKGVNGVKCGLEVVAEFDTRFEETKWTI